MKTNQKYFAEWEEAAEIRLADRTLSGYQHSLENFLSFLDKSIERVETYDVRGFLDMRAKENQRTGTIKKDYNSIKNFYEFISEKYNISPPNLTNISPSDYNSSQPQDIRRESLSREEIRKLISATRNKRNALIIGLLYYTGLRNKELCDLRIDDVDTQSQTVYVRSGKGNKSRTVPYDGSKLNPLINLWLDRERPSYIGSEDHDYIIASQRGGGLTVCSVCKIVSDCAEKAGIQSVIAKTSNGNDVHRVTPHVLRHTFATHLIEDGVDIEHISKLMGHESISTTLEYIHNTLEKSFNDYRNNFNGI